MKITIECSCGNKMKIEGNHAHFDINDKEFDCFVNDLFDEVIIECDKCNKQEKLKIKLTDYSC